jgi:hypothetical protein
MTTETLFDPAALRMVEKREAEIASGKAEFIRQPLSKVMETLKRRPARNPSANLDGPR